MWWGGEGLLRRGRTHGRRWEAVRERGPHLGVVRNRRSTRRETRGEHHPWRWRVPHLHHGRAPEPPGREEIRRWGSVRGSTGKGTVHGAHWGSRWGYASNPWISVRGSPPIPRTRLSVFLFTRPEAVFSVCNICHVCRMRRGSWGETPYMERARWDGARRGQNAQRSWRR